MLDLQKKGKTNKICILFIIIIIALKDDEVRYWESGEKDRNGDKIFFFCDIPSELPQDMCLAAKEEEKIGITRSFKKIIEESYGRKVLLFDVGHSRETQELSEVIRQKFKQLDSKN